MRNPEGAQVELERLARKHWLWAVLPNNCATFVERVLKAGGVHVYNLWNCPVTAWQWE